MEIDIRLDTTISNPSTKRLMFQDDKSFAKIIPANISQMKNCFTFSLSLNVCIFSLNIY